jgi:hypothetical protein
MSILRINDRLSVRSSAGRDGDGKVPTNGTRQMLFDFVVPGNGFFASSLWVAPYRVAAAFSHGGAAVFL